MSLIRDKLSFVLLFMLVKGMKVRLEGDRKTLEKIRNQQLIGARIYNNRNNQECRLYFQIDDDDLINLIASLSPDSGLLRP